MRLTTMMLSPLSEKAEHVSRCLELALLLEVSAYPKPGNIHRTADFQGTRYEHFLASAVAIAPHFKSAAEQGICVCTGKISLAEVARVAAWRKHSFRSNYITFTYCGCGWNNLGLYDFFKGP